MTLVEQIQSQLATLPTDKQVEVLDFIAFLQQRVASSQPQVRLSLLNHPAFGSWKDLPVDAVDYQRDLRAEWDEPS